MSITYKEYWSEIENSYNQCMIDFNNSEDTEFSTIVFESLENHDWVVYYNNNYDVLKHSGYEEYYFEEFGISNNLSFKDILLKSAYWAMCNDILDFEL